MKISLTNSELIELVKKEVSSLGFFGDINIEFNAKRGGEVETVIEIYPGSREPQNEVAQPELDQTQTKY